MFWKLFEAMSAFSAANCIQDADVISACSDGTSMVTEAPILDDDEFMSIDEMTIDVEITTLPTDLQMLIFQFQYQSRVKVRWAAGCERYGRIPCICRKRNRDWQNRVIEARRNQNNVRMQRYAAALQ